MSKRKKFFGKRVLTFRNSDSSLTSDRVKVILSSKEDSIVLADAVRALRHQPSTVNKQLVDLNKDTKKELKELQTE